ncbi:MULTISPECIES: D-alanyl-D-alanine-carboxypeptidase/endopeptidase AmpH [Brucella/Ochrobactrum group]|uniref:D-alanyl-D-alanine-carboxypeptidase/endopeptidase AmpH n=1 Tax=Ochrobactrum teleogrylli TaxID=2479765 RepID=A0ABD5K3G7_9HYPH|nr:D-alanyl-D-alanine-carboxypeptidase/endopeptidase AmpH [Brucella sp. NM4]WHS29479.1 D-alanyl-D-alanine-carboxypeptidase/endopeptidase AmpH [Brucella sp. NM4]WHT45045.1 D-alanyl-D-alanine-carboxypeptidase/endopeptidase AmpH [Ochrobactrum sp. SSR]
MSSRMLAYFTTVSLVATSLIFTDSSKAKAEDLALKDAVSMAGMQLFLNSGAPGLIIAVVQGDDSVIQAYGETAPGNDTEPDARSIFRIASVSKVFAGDLLAALAAKGKLKLTDPLQKYAPEGAKVEVNGRPITLLDLATHSAGLPRELPNPDTKITNNPFEAFDRDYYWKWMSSNQPAYAPGTTTIYSNLGYGLLGDALAKAGGADYSTVLANEVLKPAGLTDTTNVLSDEQKKRLMTGLDPLDKPDANSPVPDIMYASAGIYTSAEDMVRWMRWHLDGASQLREDALLDHTLWLPYDGLKHVVGTEVTAGDGMGLGWVATLPSNQTPFLLGKSGGLGGFMSYVVLSPNRKLGIFVVASRVNFAMFENIHSQVRELAAELAR